MHFRFKFADETKDIALIEVDFVASNFLLKGTTDISVKNRVTAYGFPNKFELPTGLAFDGEINSTHNGLTIKMDGSYVGSNMDDIPAIENIQGWSGSGIFKVADDGELFLIGISSRLPDRDNVYGIMKCVSIDEILKFIESEKLGSLEVVTNSNKERLFKKTETIITEADLKELIAKKENAKLDFKREWYKEKDLKTELIKDIIALTNGNIHTIGQPSYLVIGVKEGSNGNELHHVELDKSVDEIKKQLLQNLQNYATPSIHDLEIEEFVVDSKNIVVVEIPFHPYLVILKEKLRQFPKDTLLYRAGEGTVSADYATRKAFEEALEEYKANHESIIKQPVLVSSAVNTLDNDFIQEVFDALEREKLVVLFSQDFTPIDDYYRAIKEKSVSKFSDECYMVSIPSFTDNKEKYFKSIALSCDIDNPVEELYDWKEAMRVKLNQNSKSVLLFITDIENGNEEFDRQFATTIRTLKSEFSHFHALFIGKKGLAKLVYSNGHLSPLNTAEKVFFPETNIRIKEEYIASVFDGMLDNKESLCRLLHKEIKVRYNPWSSHELINKLFWKNLLVKNGRRFAWRDEETKEIGCEVLECIEL